MTSKGLFHIVLGLALVLVCSTASTGQSLEDKIMYGINRDDGRLLRYDFAAAAFVDLGAIHDDVGNTFSGIEASAYIPGFQNIYAFWTDPETAQTQLLYVNCENALGAVLFDNLEGGKITGAVAVPDAGAQWNVFGVQLAKVAPPFEVGGLVNLNPNNSPQNEFDLQDDASGTQLTRDDLHKDADVDDDGVYYTGAATLIRFKPKGNGDQNGLLINGEPYALQNSNTYVLSGEMQVRVFNDHIHNAKAMGHWWLQITGGTAIFVDDVQVETPDRLVKVDHKTGVVNELMTLSRGYDSLASTDGATFYAVAGDELYLLNASDETETYIGTISADDVFALEFADDGLMGFEIVNDRLMIVNKNTAASSNSGHATGMYNLGTMVFTPTSQDVSTEADSFD